MILPCPDNYFTASGKPFEIFTNWLPMACHSARMPNKDPPEQPTEPAPKSLSYWVKLVSRLWHGEQRPSRFETRLEKLSRHREQSAADNKARVLKTTATARWWRRFR